MKTKYLAKTLKVSYKCFKKINNIIFSLSNTIVMLWVKKICVWFFCGYNRPLNQKKNGSRNYVYLTVIYALHYSQMYWSILIQFGIQEYFGNISECFVIFLNLGVTDIKTKKHTKYILLKLALMILIKFCLSVASIKPNKMYCISPKISVCMLSVITKFLP